MMNRLYRLILTASLALCFLSTMAQASNPGITVSGFGEISIPNTEARVSTGVTTLRMTADESLSANSAQMQAVLDALLSVGITLDAIETTGFSFNAVYDWDDGERIFEGYQVTHSIRVTVEEVESLGPVLDLLITAGVSQIQQVRFGATDFETIKREAIEKATTDAASKAQLLADSTGVTLGAPVSINLNSGLGAISPDPLDAVAFSAPPPIAAGSHAVQASVLITYQIAESAGD